VELLPRSTSFCRFNAKKDSVQILAANMAFVICVTSPANPPFRPRFIDRVLVHAAYGGAKAIIVLNKADLGIAPDVAERLVDYERIGYEVFLTQALSMAGVDALKTRIAGKRSVLVGQSGVGKSALLNALVGDSVRKTKDLCGKYDRGRHTTTDSFLFVADDGTGYADIPGVREFDMTLIEPRRLSEYFPEFRVLAESCRFKPCMHRDEPGCAVALALERGEINPDRYESYLRILEER